MGELAGWGLVESEAVRFTILTPTFNRAHLLGRAYESLCAQTFRDFEWLIVDDGSTDNTRELVSSWKADFPIRYHWKPNGGMHTALNLGVALAAGDLTCQLDSDDTCSPRALETFDRHWRDIPNPERFAAVCGLCVNADGEAVGPSFTAPVADAYSLAECASIGGQAERWSAIRTDIWRQFPFPEFPGERLIAPGIVWNRMLSRYAVRFINEPVRIYAIQPDSLTNAGDWRYANPRGAFLYYRELAALPFPAKTRIRAALNALRFMPLSAYHRLTHSAHTARPAFQ
jgi:glycosyltransferase involved in cell wall biosynthesis